MMAEDVVQLYQQAYAEHERSIQTLRKAFQQLLDVAKKVHGTWRGIQETDSVGREPELSAYRHEAVFRDSDTWPAPAEVLRAITQWCETRRRLNEAWARVPESRRTGLRGTALPSQPLV